MLNLLTGNHLVAYYSYPVEKVFKALADRSRRALLDRLFTGDGQTLSKLCAGLQMSRQAASKHLRLLEQANLIVSYRAGREKLHYLNPVPIQEIAERWISKYAERTVGAVTALKKALEEENGS